MAVARAVTDSKFELEKLFLKANDAEATGARAIAVMVVNNTSLQWLDVSFNLRLMKAKNSDGLTAPVAAWAQALEKNSTLNMLDVQQAGLDDSNLRTLGDALLLPERTIKGLPHLSCDSFQLTPGDEAPNVKKAGEGAAILICGLLRCNATVTQLNLSGHAQGPAFLRSLAIAFRSNKDSKLVTIDLSSCFTAKTADQETLAATKELANVIRTEMTPSSKRKLAIDTHKNSGSSFILAHEMQTASTIDKKGLELSALSATVIGEWIQPNTSLAHLDLSSNKLRDEGFIAIAQALKEYRGQVSVLSLKDNDGRAQGARAR